MGKYRSTLKKNFKNIYIHEHTKETWLYMTSIRSNNHITSDRAERIYIYIYI